MTGRAVVIAGGGPTGLMLAAELALAGADVAIVERRASQEVESSRAGGLHARTIEVLDQRGIADRFLAAVQAMQIQSFAGILLDISDFPATAVASAGLRTESEYGSPWPNRTSVTPASPPSRISARRSSPPRGRTAGRTAPPGSPRGSLTRSPPGSGHPRRQRDGALAADLDAAAARRTTKPSELMP
jgi:choline dehydrogenase-like flavoprotein